MTHTHTLQRKKLYNIIYLSWRTTSTPYQLYWETIAGSSIYFDSKSHQHTPPKSSHKKPNLATHTAVPPGGAYATAIQGGSRVLPLLYRDHSATPQRNAGWPGWCGQRGPSSFKFHRLSVTWPIAPCLEEFSVFQSMFSFNLGRTWTSFPVVLDIFLPMACCGIFAHNWASLDFVYAGM